MHIADISLFFTPQNGGVQTYLRAKHKGLSKYPTVRHSILVPGSIRVHRDDIFTLPALPVPFGHGYRFPFATSAWSELLFALEPDIIESSDPYRLPWAALDAGQRLGVPVVSFYYSDLPQLVQSCLGRWSGHKIENYMRNLYSQFELVLAPTKAIAERLQNLGINRVVVQSLGVDTEQFHPKHRSPYIRKTLGLAADTRLLIFIGRGSRQKNIPLLIETVRRLGNGYHLMLVGPGMPNKSLPKNVTVLPRFQQVNQVASLLASADALIHAGNQETFGLVVLEAMASGLPIIGTGFGAVAELVDSDLGILAPEVSAVSLAEATETLFSRDFQAIGQLARQRVEQNRSWDKVFNSLMSYYAHATSAATSTLLKTVRASR